MLKQGTYKISYIFYNSNIRHIEFFSFEDLGQ